MGSQRSRVHRGFTTVSSGEFSFYDTFADSVDSLIGPQHAHLYVRRDGKFHCGRNRLRPPCECLECVQQFRTEEQQIKKVFTYTTGLSDLEAQKKAAEITQSITANLQYLKEQCNANGNSIMKRWKKKSREKREALLLDVAPDMYPRQWCDVHISHDFEMMAIIELFAGTLDTDNNYGLHRRPYRNALLLPYVNLEVLKKDPATFLNLLYNRVNYSPEQWAPYDNSLLDRQWEIGGFDLTYNGGAIIMHEQDYGKWTIWQERGAHSWGVVGFPRAILILEAQELLPHILRGVVENLVEGLDREWTSNEFTGNSDTFTKTLKPGLKSNHTTSAIEFASVYLNQPFSAPPLFNVSALFGLCQSQLDMHGDHLWLLQTDASYIRRYAAIVLDGHMDQNLTKVNKSIYMSSVLMRDAVTFWS